MNHRRTIPLLLLGVSLVTSGCFYTPAGDEVSVSVYGYKDGNESRVALSPITVSDSGFSMDGYLSAGGGDAERDIYRGVSIQLFSADGQLLCVERVGAWDIPEVKNVSISTARVPEYVILYFGDFWNEPMTVEYFEYDRNRMAFQPRDATSPAELPVDVSEEQTTAC